MSETVEVAAGSESEDGRHVSAVTVQRVEIAGKSWWQAIGAVLATIGLVWAARQASTLVAMVLISFFFSLALEPAVRRLTKRFGWRRGSATGVIYVGGALFLTFMIVILVPALIDLARVIGERGAEWAAELNQWTAETFGFDLTGPGTGAELASGTEDAVTGFADGAFGSAVGIASAGVGLVFNLATIAMFTFYFTADAPRVQSAVLKLFSPETQERIGWTWDQAIVQTGGYFYSRLILMIINGLGFFFTMVVVGMPVAVATPLAVFGAFVSVFIPAVGTYIGGAVPILLTLGVQGLTAAVIVLAYVLLYQQIENYWLSPRISAKTMNLNGGVAFGAALAGGAIAGPIGAFTALPIAALISSFISNYLASNEVVYRAHLPDDDSEGVASTPRRPRLARKTRNGRNGSPTD